MKTYDFAVVGGGFFGTYLAYMLKKEMPDAAVVLIEQEKKLFKRASHNNQARIHQGYHYPRSFLTALRSHKNFDRFVKEFKECVVDDFEKYYAISTTQSKVNAKQFETFCRRIGMPIRVAPKHIKKLLNPRLIEEVFSVREHAFDAVKLSNIMKKRLKGVEVRLGTKVASLEKGKHIHINLQGKESIEAKSVFICTYANINTILKRSGIELLDLKHEMTEMALIELPKELQGISLTVMCGPFFSFMPFPPRKLHTLSHVRYTPHWEWRDKESYVDNQKMHEASIRKTNFPYMIKDAERYFPSAKKFKYKGSLWEIKTVLSRSEDDDSRPILFKKNVGGIKNLYCVLGGKIDNVYDMDKEIQLIKRSRR